MVLEVRIVVTCMGGDSGWEGNEGALGVLLTFCFLIRVAVTQVFSVSPSPLSGILMVVQFLYVFFN